MRIFPYSSQYLHDIASVTKSVTALLTGIAIDKGFIKDENEPVLTFSPEIHMDDSLLGSLSVRHLVTMRSGFSCSAEGGEKALSSMRNSHDWIKFIFSLPMASKPGSAFSYCSGNFYLLGEIIYRVTKMTPHAFAEKYLFAPLRIEGTKWLANYKGIHHGWGDLFLHPADMTKIGQMVLDKGEWQGKQVISEQWIKKCLQTVSRLPDDKGYSYGWWTNDKAGYCEAAGRGRQTISAIPSKNMVVTMLGGEFDAGTVGKYIFTSIQSDKPLPSNSDDFSRLKKTTDEIAIALPLKAAKVNTGIIRKLNKRTLAFEENITEIDSIRFNFGKKRAVTFYRNNANEGYPLIFSKTNYTLASDPALQLPVALQAWTENDKELVLHFNQLSRVNNFYFYFAVNGNNVETIMEETTNFIKVNIISVLK